MSWRAALAAFVLAVGPVGFAQQQGWQWNRGGISYAAPNVGGGDLTIAEMRKLGLSDEQIQQIAEKRRDLEKEREALEAALAAQRAELARIGGELQSLRTVRLTRVYESVMSPEQLKAWREQGYLAQARNYLERYRTWLKLTDAQVQDIAHLLVPVYARHARTDREIADVAERLAELRRAAPVDVAAIERAEKAAAELEKQRDYRVRQEEYLESVRAGLMPDQLERLDQRGRAR